MSNLVANTPQLQAIKNLFDTTTSLNPDKLATIFSKNYQYEAFNGVTDSLAKMDRETHIEAARAVFGAATKLDVSIQQQRTILHLTNRYPTPRSLAMK